jgi:RNA polymerase primary sigma factor
MLKKKKSVNDFERSSQTYFNEISKFKPLSRDKEISLWERYRKNNDINARDKLIKSNLKFVASVARGYQGLGLSYSDLISEGNCGLMKAIDRFDYEKGFKTISYSVWWIKQSILEALKERTGIEGESLPQDCEKQNSLDIFFRFVFHLCLDNLHSNVFS